jgi:tetratricopeptide (TPR) repeat protein
MIHMLAALQKGSRGTNEIPTYLVTHPHPPERIALIQSLMSNSPAVEHREQASQFTSLFPSFKTIVKAKCLDPNDAENFFNLELEKNPDAATPHFGLGIVYKERSQYDKAIHHLKKALGKKPGFIPILTNLGEVYQLDGQYMKAISTFEEALRLDEGNKSSLFLLGLSYEGLEQYEKALRVFERLASFKPVKDEVYYHLGFCYGRLNKLAFAHYFLGLHCMRLHQGKEARIHLQKAERLSEQYPALTKKIREAMDKLASHKRP